MSRPSSSGSTADPVVSVPADLDLPDRLAGPVTFRLAGWLAAAAAGTAVAVLGWPDPFLVIAGFVLLVVGVAGGFLQPGGRPLAWWAGPLWSYWRRARAEFPGSGRRRVVARAAGAATRLASAVGRIRVTTLRRAGRGRPDRGQVDRAAPAATAASEAVPAPAGDLTPARTARSARTGALRPWCPPRAVITGALLAVLASTLCIRAVEDRRPPGRVITPPPAAASPRSSWSAPTCTSPQTGKLGPDGAGSCDPDLDLAPALPDDPALSPPAAGDPDLSPPPADDPYLAPPDPADPGPDVPLPGCCSITSGPDTAWDAVQLYLEGLCVPCP